MKAYKLQNSERLSTGFTDLFVLEASDFVVGATNQVSLTVLEAGDILSRSSMLVEVRHAVEGVLTCTLSIGNNSTPTAYMAAADVMATGNKYQVPPSGVLVPFTGAKTLVANIVCGNGTLTAAEIYVWVYVSRLNNRDIAA